MQRYDREEVLFACQFVVVRYVGYQRRLDVSTVREVFRVDDVTALRTVPSSRAVSQISRYRSTAFSSITGERNASLHSGGRICNASVSLTKSRVNVSITSLRTYTRDVAEHFCPASPNAPLGDARYRLFEVRVFGDDHGIFAAVFRDNRAGFVLFEERFLNATPDLPGTGEDDPVNVLMFDERLPDGATAAGEEIDDAVWKPGFR